MKKMRERIATLEAEVARLNAELVNQSAKSDLRIEKKELETILNMKEKIEEAYNRGFERCTQQFKTFQDMQRSMRM